MKTKTKTEKIMWERSSESKHRKGNNIFECESASGSRFVRYDTPPQLTHGLFLTKSDHEKVMAHGFGGSWTFYESSVVHFYGGNYIWCTGNDFFILVKEILGIETIWE
jgi:hypothetical protein